MCRKARLPIKGTLHQRGVHGLYYYRLAVNGTRKEFALKTSNYEEAQKAALELDRVADAPNREIAFAHQHKGLCAERSARAVYLKNPKTIYLTLCDFMIYYI